ncbi:DUF7010 family protein [Roseateles violae]|uniref:Uncharacterized protein n=1 Tax=Roseateles violae TaxID=3058042 RepID=A0ABT8DMZ1_9BURK|nr:hypothetical protein [Pelomonas sp. PFR6]MDN3919313.1 hypothetical protein [Pelomonas sp. PFR6]
MNSLDDAQADMRRSYLSGAPGMLASALAWLVAGAVALWGSPAGAVLALFAGGMLIHPLGVLLCRALGRPGRHAKSNPLGALALESTAWLILGLPLAYAVAQHHMPWFFPAMLLLIGGRYFSFQTLYGLRSYWACGAALALAGYLLAAAKAPPHLAAFAGAAIETAFAAALLLQSRRAAAAT